MKEYTFDYRGEFIITIKASSREEARREILAGKYDKIEILSDNLWDEYLFDCEE